MSKFNFKSRPCTNAKQGTRLNVLNISEDTADLALVPMMFYDDASGQEYFTGEYSIRELREVRKFGITYIPAWSIARLREMIPENIHIEGVGQVYRVLYNGFLCYEYDDRTYAKFNDYDAFDQYISCIEWLINGGYFDTNYMKEKTT